MTDITDREIETVARAICVARGDDPEQVTLNQDGWNVPRWEIFREGAITQIAAYRAIRAMEK